MTAETLVALAERVEKAEGPDRELDFLLAVRFHPDWADLTDEAVGNYRTHGTQPAYSASLDAAMTLVPKGKPMRDLCDWGDCWTVSIDWPERKYGQFDAQAKTAALALCAAALRAQAAIEERRQ